MSKVIHIPSFNPQEKQGKIIHIPKLKNTLKSSSGTKYHLFSGDIVTVLNGFEYFIACDFILDYGSSLTLDTGSRLVLHDGPLFNSGVLTNNGLIKIGL